MSGSSFWIKCCISVCPVIIKLFFHSAIVKQDNLPPVLGLDSRPQAARFVHGEGHF